MHDVTGQFSLEVDGMSLVHLQARESHGMCTMVLGIPSGDLVKNENRSLGPDSYTGRV